MPNYYVEDYEEVTGLQREDEPVPAAVVETKVVAAPETPEPETADVQVETA